MKKNTLDTDTINGINTGKAQFQFQGHYYGKPVTWQCTLQTLEQYYKDMVHKGKIDQQSPVKLRRFIEISNSDTPTPSINIVLDVEIIDEPTIRKSIIMVHNYKKLHEGLHEYGETYTYPKE